MLRFETNVAAERLPGCQSLRPFQTNPSVVDTRHSNTRLSGRALGYGRQALLMNCSLRRLGSKVVLMSFLVFTDCADSLRLLLVDRGFRVRNPD